MASTGCEPLTGLFAVALARESSAIHEKIGIGPLNGLPLLRFLDNPHGVPVSSAAKAPRFAQKSPQIPFSDAMARYRQGCTLERIGEVREGEKGRSPTDCCMVLSYRRAL